METKVTGRMQDFGLPPLPEAVVKIAALLLYSGIGA